MSAEYTPACTAESLKALYAVKDALYRGAYVEASDLVFEALAVIQNEFDGCYRTDPVIPYMRAYFITLNTAISLLLHDTATATRVQALRIVAAVATAITEIGNSCKATPTHATPDLPDRLDRELRINIYADNLGLNRQ